MKNLGAVMGFAVVAVMAAAPAWAIPVTFNSGSFAIGATTPVHSDVMTTTTFHIVPPDISIGFKTGDFVALGGSMPTHENVTDPVKFTTPGASTFDFTDPAFGAFSAFTVTFLGTVNTGPFVAVSYGVVGLYTLGTDWANVGAQVPAEETWSLTQTGGTNKSISMSGTFFADVRGLNNVPEPATLALFGAGLAGFGAMRRRKKAD